MKINDIAVKYGVSKQAIYQRLKAGKVNLDMIRNKETQQLYPEGEALLLSWYNSSVNQDNADQCLTVDQLIKLKDQALKELEEARKRIQDLEAQQEHDQTEHESQIAELKSKVKEVEDQAKALQQAGEILSVKLEAAEQHAQDLQAQIVLYESRVIPLLPKPQEAAQQEKPFTIRQRLAILFTGTAPESKKEKNDAETRDFSGGSSGGESK